MTLILYNGAIHTMDPARPLASAVACRDGRILAVGADAAARAAAGPGAESIDLHGRTVIPGLTDAHVHFLWYAVGLSRPNLDGARSLPEALARLRVALGTAGPGEWILGSGWNHEDWARPIFPCRQDLDLLTPDRPVVLRRKDGHSVWANSLALERAGISAKTADPAGGVIDRDEHGDPTGILRENAMDLVLACVPQPGPDSLRLALRAGMARAHAAGLTGIHDMEGPEALAQFQEAHARGELKLRVTMQIPAGSLDHALALGLRTGLGDDMVRIGHLKLFADGSLGSQTAWMLQPFAGQPGNTGVAATPPEVMEQMVERAAQGGIACAIHAIGDRANRQALDIHQRVCEGPWAGLRQRLEHVQLLHPDDLPRLAQLGVVASMQPIHATSDRYTADRLWGDRCRFAYAWRGLLDSGAVLAFGSDCPVESLEPLQGIYAAVTRKRAAEADSEPWHPKQCVTVEEAVRAFTWGSAYACGQENRLGTITPGKLADLVVLSQDIFVSPPESILAAQVDHCIVGGEVVHQI
jgi:predicted amidohydrolase YtcJ